MRNKKTLNLARQLIIYFFMLFSFLITQKTYSMSFLEAVTSLQKHETVKIIEQEAQVFYRQSQEQSSWG